MTTKLVLSCDGICGIPDITTDYFKRTFHSFSGKGYGFGTYVETTTEELVGATGWVHVNPYTGCTYCPGCWSWIISGGEDTT